MFHFNAKIKVAVLWERQVWVPPQIKDLRFVIPEHYTFMDSNIFFIALGNDDKHLEKTTLIKSTLPPRSYKTTLDTSPPPKLLSLRHRQINKVKNKLDGQPSSLLASMHVSDYKSTFSAMHLVFLEQTHIGNIWILRYLMRKTTKLSRGHSISNY